MNDSIMEYERPTTTNIKKFFQKLNYIIFDFHEYNFSNKQPYILTPCNHAFHSVCLESWMKQKRECPTDRTPLDIIDNS